jgi:hypothetical protein
MKQNMSHKERSIRLAASAALVLLSTFGGYSMTIVWTLYGVALLLAVTAAARHCPMYSLGQFARRKTGSTGA